MQKSVENQGVLRKWFYGEREVFPTILEYLDQVKIYIEDRINDYFMDENYENFKFKLSYYDTSEIN